MDREMNRVQKLLFVCSFNQRRSTTAERLFQGASQFEVRSAGTERGARNPVSEELLLWADLIFVMDEHHVQTLRKHFKQALKGKRVICLQIPDKYGFMSFNLIDEFREKLSLYVQVPKTFS